MPLKAVTTAGTRVQLTTTRSRVNAVILIRNPANTGKIFIGYDADSENTGASVSSSAYDAYLDAFGGVAVAVTIGGGGDHANPVDPSQIYLDSAVNAEGVIWMKVPV